MMKHDDDMNTDDVMLCKCVEGKSKDQEATLGGESLEEGRYGVKEA